MAPRAIDGDADGGSAENRRPPGVALRPARASSSTRGWLGALERTARIGKEPHRLLASVINEIAQEHGDRLALIGDAESLTYRALSSRQNRYAGWARREGLTKGDTVCLMMPNRPEYLAVWLGLTQVGVVVALINVNLTGGSLAHCIGVAAPRAVIVASELLESFAQVASSLACDPAVWVHGPATTLPRIDLAIEGLSDEPVEVAPESPVTVSDRALLIYTSGTTGLPKAANVSHHRLMMWSHWFAGLVETSSADRMYDCLPLYHSVGGVVATGSLLVSGGSVVIREKFSASRFWTDVVETDCTLFQYIGELCRYLGNAPPNPLERAHRLRLCAGNGLRSDVWEMFQRRFAIPRILEFYAATEGTVSFYNVEEKIGAVGRVPAFMAHRSPAAIIRHDQDTGEPARDANGFCQRVEKGEAGELIGRLTSDPAIAEHRFEGYTQTADSGKKVLHDVFIPGDRWLRTGDLMRQDAQGFFFFVDRVGDTFRWKGENVATTEVADVLGRLPEIYEASVYGVIVPGTEGRAGMAALRVTPDFDLKAFRNALLDRLPPYARPLFLRIRDEMEITDTYKQKKASLIADGFDPERTNDALYVDDPMFGAYRRIDPALRASIVAGDLRL